MINMLKKNLLLLILTFFLTGCTKFAVPVQTQTHPATSNQPVSIIKLSPLLDLNEEESLKKIAAINDAL